MRQMMKITHGDDRATISETSECEIGATDYASPKDLAGFVYRALGSPQALPLRDLERLVNAAFSASLQTAEGGKVSLDILVRIDSNKWDTKMKRGSLLPFHSPRRLDANTLVQLAQGLQFDRTGVAAECNGGNVDAVGLTDVGRALFGDSQFLASSGAVRLTIAAPGRLLFLTDGAVLAELRGGALLTKQSPVVFRENVRERLRPGADRLVAIISHLTRTKRRRPFQDSLFNNVERARLLALFDLLRSIRSLGHGGSLIIAAGNPDPAVLNVGFSMSYAGIPNAVREIALALWPSMTARSLDGTNSKSEPRAIRMAHQQLEDSIRFVAQLSRVDGITIIDEQFGLVGFGAMAISTDTALPVHSGARSHDGVLSPYDISSRGARHRSIIATCARIPDAVGFIVSQDGNVRTVIGRGSDVVVWDQFSEA